MTRARKILEPSAHSEEPERCLVPNLEIRTCTLLSCVSTHTIWAADARVKACSGGTSKELEKLALPQGA